MASAIRATAAVPPGIEMDHEFWRERWRLNQIGFHQAQFNERLVRYWSTLELPAGGRVFVPLCGKSRDMAWLAGEGHPVSGVELAPQAIKAFFNESSAPYTDRQEGAFTAYEGAGLRIYCGDFFELTSRELDGTVGVFDRGALVALPREMRRRYVEHLLSILPPHTEILLLTIEYDQNLISGPPFSVQSDEVEALFGKRCSIDLLERTLSDRVPAHFLANGIREAGESVYRIVKR